MANIRKSFNFRNGVQVDNDNFVVDANGLVGIGTSIPSNYLLNVHGNTRITGLTTVGSVFVSDGLEVTGITTAGLITASNANVTGVLTAAQFKLGSSEVVSNLIGYARTSFITDNGAIGLHTSSKIGINTTTSPGTSDPSLVVIGDANISGVVTAASFDGNLNASGITTGTLDNARLPSSISVTDVTATTFTGTATTAQSLTGTPTIVVNDVTATTLTVTGDIDTSGDAGIGTSPTEDLHVYGDQTRVLVDSSSSTSKVGVIFGDTGTTVGGVLYDNSVDSLEFSTNGTTERVRITSAGDVGIGTTTPTTGLTLKRGGSDDATVEVISESGESRISLGQTTSTGNSSAQIRYKDTKLECINYDVGNIDTYIHKGTGAGSTGNFRWIYGQDNSVLLNLSYEGNLGINGTSDSHKLYVGGGSTFTGSAHFDSNVTITGAVTVGSINLPSVIVGSNLSNGSGISTFNNIIATGTASTISTLTVDSTLNAGNLNVSGVASITSSSSMVVPSLTDAEEVGLGSTIVGAIIYNSTDNKFRGYTGTEWVDFH